MSYYTPSIDEFHFGFEYEYTTLGSWSSYLRESSDWVKQTFTCGNDWEETEFEDVKHLIEEKKLRVKHLDKSDIVSLGWEFDNNAEPIPPREGEFELPSAYVFEQGLNQYIMYVYKDNTIWIEHILDCAYQGYIFKGSCRNKSELSKIMKLLNIKLTN